MTPEEVLNRHELAPWSDNYDWHCSPECGESGSMRGGESHAEHVLAALGVAGYAITKLPEPFPIEVSEIDMDPTGEPEWGGEPDHRARMVVRFSGASRPGRLFDRRELAAALLAAEAAAEENQ